MRWSTCAERPKNGSFFLSLHLKTGAKIICRNVVVLIDNYPSIHLYPVICHKAVRQGKGKAIPVQAWTDTEDSNRLRLPDFQTNGGKIASPTHRPPLPPPPPGNICVTGKVDPRTIVRPEGLCQ
jgi:hypothetical protein